MEKALAIFEKTEEGTKAVFFDQETIECARLNVRTKKRVEQAAMEHRANLHQIRKAEAARERFKAYTYKTCAMIAIDCGAVWGLTQAGIAGLIHPAIFFPVGLLFLCGACVRLGVWLGRAVRK